MSEIFSCSCTLSPSSEQKRRLTVSPTLHHGSDPQGRDCSSCATCLCQNEGSVLATSQTGTGPCRSAHWGPGRRGGVDQRPTVAPRCGRRCCCCSWEAGTSAAGARRRGIAPAWKTGRRWKSCLKQYLRRLGVGT